MKSLTEHIKRVGLAVIALSSVVVIQGALAGVNETPANTNIDNFATVNYQVGGVTQTAVPSNTTTFKVDRKVIFAVSERSGGPTTPVSPNQLNVVTSFTVANTGNAAEDFQLSAANLVGTTTFTHLDNQQMLNLRVFVDSNANNTYDAGVDTQTFINALPSNATAPSGNTVTVFIVADAPNTATNGQYADVQLTARAAVSGSAGATLETESASDTTSTVDVVIADTGRNNSEAAVDQYAIVSAALAVTKTSAVIFDPINCPTFPAPGSCGANVPKAIPGATVEYRIVVDNALGATDATAVSLDDSIPANTTYVPNSITYQVNAGAATALSDAADTDRGAYLASGTPRILIGTSASNPGSPAVTVPATQSVTIRFRVTVN